MDGERSGSAPVAAARSESHDADLAIEFVDRAEPWQGAGLDRDLIERALRRGLEAARWPTGQRAEVAVVLADDAQIRALNAAWRQRDAATNVLSFGLEPAGLPAGHVSPLGDIVLAFETVSGEARSGGLSLSDHCAHLALHGLLHLLGYDHQSDGEAVAMEALETRVLTGLGIADPYDCQPDKAAESAFTARER